MKLLKAIAKFPLFVAIIISGLGLTAYGYFSGKYNISVTMDHPILAAVLTADYVATDGDADRATATDAPVATDGDSAAGSTTGNDGAASGDGTKDTDSNTGSTGDNADNNGNGAGDNTDGSGGIQTGPDYNNGVKIVQTDEVLQSGKADNVKAPIPTKYQSIAARASRSPDSYNDVNKIALTTAYPYIDVDESYFDDAVFIGDSRVEGLELYSGLNNTTFYAVQGLTIFGLMGHEYAKVGDSTVSLREALSRKQFKKIYIMVGVNELGTWTDTFTDAYKEAIDEIRELQPGAVIFIQGIMYVSDDYSKAHDIVNNDNIIDKNNHIAALANGVDIFYLDMNPAITDDSGYLDPDLTWDGVHLQAQYYSLWVDFLKSHGLGSYMFE